MKIQELHKTLGVKKYRLHEELHFDYLDASFEGGEFSITEDGILLVKNDKSIEARDGESEKIRQFLSNFYLTRLGPALDYLFSLGAPLPRDLAAIKTVLPFIVIISNATPDDLKRLYTSVGAKETSVVVVEDMEIHRTPTLTVFHIRQGGINLNQLEAFIRHDIFFREFEFQLEEYMTRHRLYWDEISKVRESTSLRYKNFPHIRRKLLEIRRTITYVEMRLLQMRDILMERAQTITQEESDTLNKFGLHRFQPLEAAQGYTEHLWQMTLQYLDGTINLLNTLYEENTQRELTVIKMTTFATALTGFFGMNIPFPWEERWDAIKYDSFYIVMFVILGSILFYFILKFAVLNRKFSLGDKK